MKTEQPRNPRRPRKPRHLSSSGAPDDPSPADVHLSRMLRLCLVQLSLHPAAVIPDNDDGWVTFRRTLLSDLFTLTPTLPTTELVILRDVAVLLAIPRPDDVFQLVDQHTEFILSQLAQPRPISEA